MYRQTVFSLSIVGSILATGPAFAESPWYIGGSAGAYFRSDYSVAGTFHNGLGTTAPGTNTTTFSPGPIFNASVGYKLAHGFRVEGEFGFTKYNIKSINPNTVDSADFPNLNGTKLSAPIGGDRERYIETVNLFYDLPFTGRFVPYIGAGFGAAEDRGSPAIFNEIGPVPGGTFRTSNAATGVLPVALAEAGVTLKLADQWAVVPSYRFQYVFRSGNVAAEPANIVKIGLRRSF